MQGLDRGCSACALLLFWRLPMPRRTYLRRNLRMEALEFRCNPSAVNPLDGSVATPAPDVGEVEYFEVMATGQVVASGGSGEVGSGINISSFAGQTIRLRFAEVDNRSRPVDGGAGNDVLVGGGGRDVLVGGDEQDTLSRDVVSDGEIAAGESDSAATLEDNQHGTHVAGTIGVVGNNGLSPVDDGQLDLLSSSERDRAEPTAGYQTGYIGWVKVSPD